MLSDSDILRYYKDPFFAGSFSGVRVFQMFLKTDLNEQVSVKRIFKLLKQDSNYLLHQRRILNYPTRSYDIQSFAELLQGDLVFVQTRNLKQHFLIIFQLKSYITLRKENVFNIFVISIGVYVPYKGFLIFFIGHRYFFKTYLLYTIEKKR